MARRPLLTLRLGALATPSRVADAAHMLEAAIEAGYPDVAAETSLIVENRDMIVRLGGWSDAASEAGEDLVRFIVEPTAGTLAADAPAMASVMEDYGRGVMDLRPAFFKPRGRRVLRKIDESFLHELRRVQEMPIPPTYIERKTHIRGSTSVVSPVLRVGRVNERAKRKARILYAGRPHDIEVDGAIYADFCEAAKTGRLVKIHLEVAWVKRPNGLEFASTGAKAVLIEPFDGAAFKGPSVPLRQLSAREAREVYRGLKRGDDDE